MISQGKNRKLHLVEFLDRARAEFGDRECAIHNDRSFRSGEFLEASERLAGSLRELGLRPGDRVLTLLANDPRLFAIYNAVWRAGLVLVPLNTSSTSAEVAELANETGARAIVAGAPLVAVVERALPDIVGSLQIIAFPALEAVESGTTAYRYEDLVAGPRLATPVKPDDDLAAILFTGGTTARSKGVLLTHENIHSGISATEHRDVGLTSVFTMPLFHIGGIVWSHMQLRHGYRTVFVTDLSPESVLASIERYRADIVHAVPSTYVAMMEHPEAARFDVSSVKYWVYGASAFPEEQRRALERQFGGRVDGAYGLTETSGLVATTEHVDAPKPNSAGCVSKRSDFSLRVAGDDGAEAATEEVGELWIKGSGVARGYLGAPEATDERFVDGWLRTGDLARVDRDGELFIVGRIKDVISRSGENVYPGEIEDVILGHDAVVNAAVVGLPNELLGEEVVAFVALSVGAETDAVLDELAARCRENLAAYKRPRFEIIDDIPRTKVGKIDKNALRESGVKRLTERRDSELRDRLQAMPPNRRFDALAATVTDVLSEILDVAREDLSGDRQFTDLGLTSLHAVELSYHLRDRLGVPVSATIAFNQPTVSAVTRQLLKVIAADEDAPQTAPPTAPRRAPRRAADDAVAIISMACRFPGDANTPEAYWRLVDEGRDAVSEFPRERWDVDALYDPDPGAAGKSYAREGGFLRHIDRFDAGVFGITPREAESMDPQQRILLEVTWEALERARIAPDTLREADAGVYVGMYDSGYREGASPDLERLDGYVGTGNLAAVASGRIAYTLGLEGPAITVDTACSASLVAIHLACQALRAGECEVALAGGITLMATPGMFVEFSRLGGLSPTGRCKSFSAEGDGTGWGEGCGMLVLKPLSDAERDGDRVLGLIRGTAVNQDGRSQGLTAPNGPSQERVIQRALETAGVAPTDIDYVEAHGTGTQLGDPIEAEALANVIGRDRPADAPVYLGSVKSNIAHTQAAAGVAGVMKVVLSLSHERLPRTLHADEPNQHIAWERNGLALLHESVPWRREPRRARRAGVSSFGISGTNAHVIVEEPPQETGAGAPEAGSLESAEDVWAHAAVPLLLSGHTEDALRANALRLAEHLEEGAPGSVLDTAYSLSTTRAVQSQRMAVVVATEGTEEAISRLRSIGEGGQPSGTVVSQMREPGKVAVLFTGQGSQWAGMGKRLSEVDAQFRRDLEEVAGAFERHLERELLPVMLADETRQGEAGLLDETAYTQPALFALEVALYRRLERAGVVANALLGHSIGELVAAHVAGVFSLEDAVKLVAARARLMQACRRGGAMASLQASEEEVRPHLSEKVNLAGVNGPSQTVISGDADDVEAVASVFEGMGRKVTRLSVSHAFHSAHMESALAELEEVASSCRLNAPKIPVISNVTGKLATTEELSSPRYWARHVREPVRFADGVKAAFGAGARTFIECGPHGVLCGMASGCLPEDAEALFVPTLRKGEDAAVTFGMALGAMHVAGHRVDWEEEYARGGARVVDLPTYAFQRQAYWLTAPRATSDASLEGVGEAAPWSLAGRMISLPEGGFLHVLEVGPAVQTDLADHLVFGYIVVPGAFYVSVLLAIAGSHWPGQAVELQDVQFIEALTYDDPSQSVTLHIHLVPDDETAALRATVASWRGEKTTVHARARLLRSDATERLPGIPESSERPTVEPVDETVLDVLRSVQVDWRPRWRWLRAIERAGELKHGHMEAPTGVDATGSPLPAGLLDNSWLVMARPGDEATGERTPQLPFSIDRIVWTGRSAPIRIASSAGPASRTDTTTTGDLLCRGARGEPVIALQGVTLRRAPRGRFLKSRRESDLLSLSLEALPSDRRRDDAAISWITRDPARDGLAELDPEIDVVVIAWPRTEPTAEAVESVTRQGLAWLQDWLAAESLAATRVVWLTRDAMTLRLEDEPANPAAAALWGIGRTFQSEYPDRPLVLLDVNDEIGGEELGRLLASLPEDEGSLAWRGGEVYALRLEEQASAGGLVVPGDESAWRLDMQGKDRLDAMRLVESTEGSAPLRSGQVRIEVRAAGLSTGNALDPVDTYPGDVGRLGREGAGVVLEVAEDVEHINPGDWVFGALYPAFGSVAVAEVSAIERIPKGMTFAEAAAKAGREDGQIEPLPPRAFDMRMAPDVLRHMTKGRRAGEVVLCPPRRLDPTGTVLITGGTGGLARVMARYLVEEHGVRHLLLLSRSGAKAKGADELEKELADIGAKSVTLRACDVSDREQLEQVVGDIPPERGLTAVFHLAGVLDDGPISELSPERISRVLRPKVHAAFYLDELTKYLDLSAFVLFSSAVGTLGNAAQGNYAAANAALDALAVRRQRGGLPGLSLAWGPWQGAGMTARLDEALQRRLRRAGFVPMDEAHGMRLLDEALGRPDAALLPMPLDRQALQRAANEAPETVTPMLRRLVRPERKVSPGAASRNQLADTLSQLPEEAREEAVLDAVRAEVAAVMGLPGAEAVPKEQPLLEFGVDSLMAVEVRNRLSSLVGEKLPVSWVFDYPTVRGMSVALTERLGEGMATAPEDEEEQLRRVLTSIPISKLRDAGLLSELLRMSEGPPETLSRPVASAAEPRDYVKTAESMTESEIDAELDDILDSG